MFNFFSKIASLFHTKPSVSYLQPKTINVYFKNALNPKYILLNINHYNYCELEIVASQNNNNNVFILAANLYGEIDTQLDLAMFETRVEADRALMVLRNKLFGIDKKIVKFTSMFIVLTILVGLFGNMFDGLIRKIPANNAVSMNNQLPNQPLPNSFALPTPVNTQDMIAMQKKLENNIEAGKQNTNNAQFAPQPVQPAQPVAEPETSSNPEVNSLLNNLGK